MKKLTFQLRHLSVWAFLFGAFVATLSLASCKKNSDSASSKATLLTGGKWTLQSIEFQKKDGSWEAGPKPETTLEFHDDKTVILISKGSSSIRAWTLSDDLAQLTIARASGGADTFKIVQLNSSTLQLSPVPYNSTTYLDERDSYTR